MVIGPGSLDRESPQADVGAGIQGIAVDAAADSGQQASFPGLPGHLAQQVGVRARNGKLSHLSLEIDAQRAADGPHGSLQGKGRIRNQLSRHLEMRGLGTRGGETVRLQGEPIEIDREWGRDTAVDDTGAPIRDGEMLHHHRHLVAFRLAGGFLQPPRLVVARKTVRLAVVRLAVDGRRTRRQRQRSEVRDQGGTTLARGVGRARP